MHRITKRLVLGLFAFLLLSSSLLGVFLTEKSSAVIYKPDDGSDSFTMDAQFFNRQYWQIFSITFTRSAIDNGWLDKKLVTQIGNNTNGKDPTDNGIDIINTFAAQQVSGANGLFFDSQYDGTLIHIHEYQGCKSEFKYQEGAWQLVNLSLTIPGVGCKNILGSKDIRLPSIGATAADPNWVAYQILFSWKNGNTIIRVDGREGDFVQGAQGSPNYPNRYFRVDEQGEGDQDYLDVLNDNALNYYINGSSEGSFAIQGQENKTKTPTEVDENGNVVRGSGQDRNATPDCYSGLKNVFSWLLCGVLGIVDDFIAWAEEAISKQLTVDLGSADTRARLQDAWAIIARFSSAILVIIALFMIISTALGSDLVSAYTMKKVLPRLVIGAVFMWLSWSLVSTYIDIVNDLGRGVAGIMLSPFTDETRDITLQGIMGKLIEAEGAGTGESTLFLGLATAGIAGAGVFGLLGLGVSALAAFFFAVVVLALRQAIIIFLITLAPLGVAAWILPNTQKMWKLWSGTLNKLLIMFPIIMGLLAAGKIFSSVIADSLDSGDSPGERFMLFSIALIAYIAPFFIMPTVFKAASGLLSNLTGLVNNKGKGLFDKMRGNLDKRKALSNREIAKKQKDVIRAQKRQASFASGLVDGKLAGFRRFRSGGLRSTTRERLQAAAIGTQAADREKALKDQATLLNHRYATTTDTVINQATGQPIKMPETQWMLNEARDQTGERRQAAIDRLASMRAISELEQLHRDLRNSPEGRRDWEEGVRRNYDNLREAAPHIVASTGEHLNPDRLMGASMEGMAKWNEATWTAYLNHVNGLQVQNPAVRAVRDAALAKVQTLIGNQRLTDTMGAASLTVARSFPAPPPGPPRGPGPWGPPGGPPAGGTPPAGPPRGPGPWGPPGGPPVTP